MVGRRKRKRKRRARSENEVLKDVGRLRALVHRICDMVIVESEGGLNIEGGQRIAVTVRTVVLQGDEAFVQREE